MHGHNIIHIERLKESSGIDILEYRIERDVEFRDVLKLLILRSLSNK